ncbi:MAG: hypothetical protein RLZZ618_428 [Pseudomonadota bacterium]|jgi:hypothetical protein
MHLMIPFASAVSDASRLALRELSLPHLSKLLARLAATRAVGTDEYTLNTPFERALADEYAWTGDDGCLPWAAHAASQDGVATAALAWGQLTPVHWHVAADHVALADPQSLHLSAQASRTLFEAILPLFQGEGWSLAWGSPTRWYASHDSLNHLPSASIDRVIGRNIDLWLPNHPQARLVRRMQNEVQMLLYQHPLNDERVGLGALPVNSFWLSGCGRAQPTRPTPGLHIDNRLRAPQLAGDVAAWADAWRALDAEVLGDLLAQARKGKPVTLTLCGERRAQRFDSRQQGMLSNLRQALSVPPAAPMLASL